MLCPLQGPRKRSSQERHGLHGQRRRYRRNLLRLLHESTPSSWKSLPIWTVATPSSETDFSLSGGTARGVAGASGGSLCSTGVCLGGRRKTASRRRCPTARLSQVSIQSGFEAAIAEMNDAIAASMMAPTRAGRLHVRYVSGTSRPDRRPLTGASPTSIYKFTPAGKIRQG